MSSGARTVLKAGVVCLLLVACVVPAAGQAPAPAPVASSGTVQFAFTPQDDAEGMIVAAINGAKRQILVQAFNFTSRKLAHALIAAKRRGVDVRVTADRAQTFSGESSRIPDLAAAGIPVRLEIRYQNAHNKVMVIDAGLPDSAVVTGSYNWTYAAQRANAENVLILRRNPQVARAYAENWNRHAAEAVPYDPAQAGNVH